MDEKKLKIILSGGGTGGSVTPLLAICDIIKDKIPERQVEFLLVGTKTGPERLLAESAGIGFAAIYSGKLRRYWSWSNISDLFRIKIAFFQSLGIITREKPDLVISAGSFSSVPLVWASYFLRIPILIQQLDLRPGLANRLMAPCAKKIMVTFRKSLDDYGSKAVLVGNPVRKDFKVVKVSKREAMQKIGFYNDKPVVMVIGGGTGASAINACVIENVSSLTKFCQILHVTGRGKSVEEAKKTAALNSDYKFFEFLDTFGVIKAFAAADLIISRAGIGTLTELSYVRKPAIIIPMPGSHQEENAAVFLKEEAAVVLDQDALNGKDLIDTIRNILHDGNLQAKLITNIKNVIDTEGEDRIAELIRNLI